MTSQSNCCPPTTTAIINHMTEILLFSLIFWPRAIPKTKHVARTATNCIFFTILLKSSEENTDGINKIV